jgi:hypothetical protein
MGLELSSLTRAREAGVAQPIRDARAVPGSRDIPGDRPALVHRDQNWDYNDRRR